MARLITTKELHRDILLEIAEARLAEFRALRSANLYAGAVYLAGYVVEALLKRGICLLLQSDELPVIYHSHDLEALLFFSGLQKEMEASVPVRDCFNRITSVWNKNDGSPRVRYGRPSDFSASACNDMNQWLNDASSGVVPWLKGHL